jgi:hypothetical protein
MGEVNGEVNDGLALTGFDANPEPLLTGATPYGI